MSILTTADALTKRRELLEQGYCLIPGVLSPEMLDSLRKYTDALIESRENDPKYRYQGDVVNLATERQAALRDVSPAEHSPLVDQLIDWGPAWEAFRAIGLENQRGRDDAQILSKPPGGPPLYWHQDCMHWNNPESAAPWPTQLFIMYYLTDTIRENGCLRVIPGTHHRRIPLHSQLPEPHSPEIQAISDLNHPIFADQPDAVDIMVKAGDLVIGDGRVLHGAYGNNSSKRRTLVIMFHNVFDFPNPPSWWTGDIPEIIRNYDPSVEYVRTRTPGALLTSEGSAGYSEAGMASAR